MQQPDCVVLDSVAFTALLSRIDASHLPMADIILIKNIMHFNLWLQQQLETAKITIKKLRNLFNISKSQTEKGMNLAEPIQGAACPPAPYSSNLPDMLKSTIDSRKSAKGHGRQGASAYQEVKVIEVSHDSLKTGDPCPLLCGGKIYQVPAGSVIKITGQAMAVATQYVLEKLRCGLCGSIFTAPLPSNVSVGKYDYQLKSLLGIHKYYLGMPFYRLEKLQCLLGVPLPDATQWELVEQLGGVLLPIYHALEREAANGEIIYHDDTVMKILSLIRENRNAEIKRKGMFITGVVSKVNQHRIYLFYAGRAHAGENVARLLQKREVTLGKFIQMCDALHLTFTEEFKSILCHCLAHGRRRFYEIYSYYPEACWFVIHLLAKVYRYDKDCQEQALDKIERLKYHQTYSAPLMQALKLWLVQQIAEKLVEPNSSLGKAIGYFQKHWLKLTQFLHVPGAPLDNNVVEQALKIPIRLRKNALFYKTVYGAYIGSVIMSVLHTCGMAKQNPLVYLNTLQAHKDEVLRDPKAWLPWHYQQTLMAQQQ